MQKKYKARIEQMDEEYNKMMQEKASCVKKASMFLNIAVALLIISVILNIAVAILGIFTH